MRKKRILVVDDEKNIRLTLRHVLEDEGLEVKTASDGHEALDQVRAHDDFALMLLDLKMPGPDGLEVLRQVHALRPELPVVVFTAHGKAENATEAMRLGAADFAEKPFSPTQIRALVNEVRRDGARPPGDRPNDTRPETTRPQSPPYRTLVFLSDPASSEALLRLAAASSQSYERGEVVAVGLEAAGHADERHADDESAPVVDLAAAAERAEDLGVAVRTRTVERAAPHKALPSIVEEETPDHALLEWTGPVREARALDALAQQIATEAGCEVTLARPGARAQTQRIAAVMSQTPHTLVAVRRALEFAKSAGVASLTLLNAQPPPADGDDSNPMEDGLALIHRMAREAGLPQDKYYTQVAVAKDVAAALPRVAEDFDTFCISAAHADTLIPALFGNDGSRITGTVALVRGSEQTSPTIMSTLINRLAGT